MILEASDHAIGLPRQSGRLTRLNTTIDFCISHIEGAEVADDFALVFESSRIVAAVRLAVIRITRVITVNGSVLAGELDAIDGLDGSRKHRRVGGQDAHRADDVISRGWRTNAAAGGNDRIPIGGNGDFVPGRAHGAAFNVLV